MTKNLSEMAGDYSVEHMMKAARIDGGRAESEVQCKGLCDTRAVS